MYKHLTGSCIRLFSGVCCLKIDTYMLKIWKVHETDLRNWGLWFLPVAGGALHRIKHVSNKKMNPLYEAGWWWWVYYTSFYHHLCLFVCLLNCMIRFFLKKETSHFLITAYLRNGELCISKTNAPEMMPMPKQKVTRVSTVTLQHQPRLLPSVFLSGCHCFPFSSSSPLLCLLPLLTWKPI